ncbi:trypsin-like peptidase domain-containing protein [Streptomyces sp. NPDC058284]|uniref:trypsin-like peptidase domain-containing protein n=1 Tax=unclassified Streptomyces TaxID=2593676 RepID=UPI00364672C8
MAGRGPRAGGPGDAGTSAGSSAQAPDRSLVRLRDLAGRPRGTGFAADEHGTVITSHEAVDGLARIVVHGPDERTCVVSADAVVALPRAGLALVRTEGLGLRPLPVTVRDSVVTGTYVRIDARGRREARVLGSAPVTYTATDRFHLLASALELAIGTDGADALRLGSGAAGGPVVDASTGAVLAVLGTALLPQRPGPAEPGQDAFTHRPAGYAVPLRDAATADPHGPLAELLRHNAATVPAYGRDLNLAGALHLTATSTGSDGPPAPLREPVERPDAARELDALTAGPARVLGLVGDPGTGRTTELAALAARRARGAEPAPTLWLRGADLRSTDASVADAVQRALDRAGRILEAAGEAPTDQGAGDIPAGRVARLVRDAGRPLLLLLDGPEEMPPALAHTLARWSEGTALWLRDTGARLVVACRTEYWEQAAAHFATASPEVASPHAADEGAGLPGRVHLGDLPEPQARRARALYGIPDGTTAPADARHPLALRLLHEVRAALPGAPPPGTPDREEIFAAHLDLLCLRVAERLAAANGLRGNTVRRLAAVVSGRVHEAARRCLGPGQGQLDRAGFEAVFPSGAPPGRGRGREFHGCTGWASAVLAEGLLVPAGGGYRFAHEEVADWLQGTHLDVDAALTSLVHRHRPEPRNPTVPEQRRRGPAPAAARPLPVPRHRIGPVIQALLALGRQRGAAELASRLIGLADAMTGFAGLAGFTGCTEGAGPGAGRAEAAEGASADGRAEVGESAGDTAGDTADATWWATHLLREVLLRVPDASPYLAVLEPLAERGEFGAPFWLALRLPEAERFALLRRLVVRDGPPGTPDRCLDAVADLLAADPVGVPPHLVGWFTDERPLDAAPDATVASAAQALLHTHRHRAIDDLTETLADCAHTRADELLTALAEEEPAAMCRAVARWARDGRPARHAAAAAHALRAAPHATTGSDRAYLRHAALALLAHPADDALHGPALALLVRDPQTRTRYLPHALRRFTAGDPHLPASAPATALATHPEPVLDAFRTRLHAPGPVPEDVLPALADVTTPALARRVADLVHDLVAARPEAAGPAAAYIDRRLEHGPAVRPVLFPLVTALLRGHCAQVRAALAPVLTAPGTAASRDPRDELLDVLLGQERDSAVLEGVLRAVAHGAGECGEARTRERVHRTGLLLVRTPEGASRFDRRLVELARDVPGFAVLVAGWLDAAPQDWAAVVGPSARRTIERFVGGVRMPA